MYEDAQIILHPGLNPRGENLYSAEIVELYGERYCNEFLLNSGRSISNLDIDYQSMDIEKAEKINRAVAVLGNQNLVELVLRNWQRDIPVRSFESFAGSLNNVIDLTNVNSHFSDDFEAFPQFFPNVKSYAHLNVVADGHAAYFSELDDLHISTDDIFEMVEPLIQLHTELSDLAIYVNQLPMTSFLNTIQNHEQLKILRAAPTIIERITRDEIDRLIEEHPILEIIRLPAAQCSAADVFHIIDEFENLEELEFQPATAADGNEIMQELDESEWKRNIHTDFDGTIHLERVHVIYV